METQYSLDKTSVWGEVLIWDDTCANFYTRNGDTVTVETVYRHGKAPVPFTQSLASYDAWVTECKENNWEGIAI